MSAPDPVTTGLVVAATLQVAKQAQDFIAAASGHPGESVGTILGSIFERRKHNAEIVSSKAHLTLLNIGETPQQVPLHVFQPLLEAASLQEEPELQDIWANLLANAADPRQERPVSPSFRDMLKDLTAKDAKFLNALYQKVAKIDNSPSRATRTTTSLQLKRETLLDIFAAAGLSRKKKLTSISVQEWNDNVEDYEADSADFQFSLEVFLRHRILIENIVPAPIAPGVIERNISSQTKMGVATSVPVGVIVSYSFTEIGVAFVKACQPPTKSESKD